MHNNLIPFTAFLTPPSNLVAGVSQNDYIKPFITALFKFQINGGQFEFV